MKCDKICQLIFLADLPVYTHTCNIPVFTSTSLQKYNYNIQPKNKMSKCCWLKQSNLQYWTSPYFTNIPSLQVKTSTASDQLRICASWTLFICFSRYADLYFSVARLWWLQNFANHKVWFLTLVNLPYKFKKYHQIHIKIHIYKLHDIVIR